MYGRANRNIGQLVGSTPVHVGPGTYDVNKFKKSQQLAYAPFLSLATREDIFSQFTESPGPGQYNPAVGVNSLIKGGSTIANKEQRFADKINDVPGPGTYVVENKENSRPQVQIEKVPKLKINRKRNPPSIQDPKYAYGFEEDKHGELIPQAPPDRDASMGPAYYNPDDYKLQSSYKGVHFAKYSSKRTEFAGKPGPGPGDYEPADSFHVDIQHYNLKMTDRKADLNIPRYPDMLIKTIEKESVPGPGKYEQKRLFDDKTANQNDIIGIEYERPPFGVQTKRFDAGKSLIPGPGAYNDTRIAFDSINKVHSIKNTPFLQSSTRFDGQTFKSRSAPGPGQYKLIGFAEDNLRKAIIESRRKPAFGQSAPRNFSLAKKEDYQLPGPAQYQPKEKPFKSKHDNFSSNFASTSKRDTNIEETPGPTAYNVTSAYDNLNKVKREAPRTKNAQKRQQSFNVAAKREFKLSMQEEIPGPGTYEVDKFQHKSLSFANFNDKRWKNNNKDSLPGPADYEVCFNLTK
jgi:hypothetical protein